MKFNLSRDWKQFNTTIGITDQAQDENYTVRFRIRLDDKTLYDGVLRFGDTMRDTYDVTDGLRLILEAEPRCEDKPRIVAAFGNAQLTS